MSAVHFTEEEFTAALTEGTLIVDFWATWCGPCKMIAPAVDQLADELYGKITVGKIDVDECREIAMEYGVMSIPTLIYFKNGIEVKRFTGVQTKDKLLEEAKELE
ncbi:MAG: thioredoxin [Oscillospiraceae bacterium]|nr:thioredoxin [Oscillospiraceae bacterium]MBR2640663.1 thioredoxin [Oscillospiraceae bacterium]